MCFWPDARAGGQGDFLIRCICLGAAVIALFCRQYEIIKDNDSNNHSKEKAKPLSVHSTPEYHNGGLLGNKVSPILLTQMAII